MYVPLFNKQNYSDSPPSVKYHTLLSIRSRVNQLIYHSVEKHIHQAPLLRLIYFLVSKVGKTDHAVASVVLP